jgi:protein-L-isoaspartate(D-aspartate) O-methyltransferase
VIRFRLLVVVSFLSVLGSASAASGKQDATASAREAMVQNQIIQRGVQDPRVLVAMRRVPRHRFVPAKLAKQAYDDHPLPIGEGQTISQPYIVALMSELLGLKGNERVLEIGTGSGYQAAVLGELVKEVYTIEIIPALAQRSKQTLQELGYQHVHVKAGDGYAGWPDKAPFDAIIVTCAPSEVPKPLQDQLKEGGRLVIPVGTWPEQTLYQMEKREGKLVLRPVIPVLFVPMTR